MEDICSSFEDRLVKSRDGALSLPMLESSGWSEKSAAESRRSQDQPVKFRVPGFELEGTRFQERVLARWANDMRLMDWSQRGTTCLRVIYLWALPSDVRKVYDLPQ